MSELADGGGSGTLNIPATILAKRFSPAVVIPCLMFCWGTIAAATAAVHNFGGILAARICLGVVEAGFVSAQYESKAWDADLVAVSLCNLLPDLVLHEDRNCKAD